MSRIDESLSEVFGVPVPERSNQTLPTVIDVVAKEIDSKPVPINQELDDDIEFVKNKLQSLILRGEDAVETLTSIAKSEESPRSFEVLNTMLTTLSNISMQFIELHEKKAKIAKTLEKSTPVSNTTTNTTNNIAFVGSSSDIDALLEERKKKRQQLKDELNEKTTSENSGTNPDLPSSSQ